jgi:hypothetical protein
MQSSYETYVNPRAQQHASFGPRKTGGQFRIGCNTPCLLQKSRRMKTLALKLLALPFVVPLVLDFVLATGGSSVGRWSGLTVQQYQPLNLKSPTEIVCVVEAEEASPFI